MNYIKDNLLAISKENIPVGSLAIKIGDEVFPLTIGKGGSADYYKCASVDTVNKTWTGYKAVLSEENGYAFEETLTSGLMYGKGFTPDINSIYNNDATIIVGKLYVYTPKRSVLTLVASRQPVAGVYKQVEGTEYGTKTCRWQYSDTTYPNRNIHWGTPTAGGYYDDDAYVGVEGWHVFDGEDTNKVWLGDGVFPVAPTHWDSSSVLTESFEDWE